MRKQIFWLIIVASAVVIAYLVFRALIGQVAPAYDATVSEFAAETNDRDALETNTQLKFPANATDIHGYVDGFQDVTTLLRFTLPAQDFESFLQLTSCAPGWELGSHQPTARTRSGSISSRPWRVAPRPT